MKLSLTANMTKYGCKTAMLQVRKEIQPIFNNCLFASVITLNGETVLQ